MAWHCSVGFTIVKKAHFFTQFKMAVAKILLLPLLSNVTNAMRSHTFWCVITAKKEQQQRHEKGPILVVQYTVRIQMLEKQAVQPTKVQPLVATSATV
jgi:hypothetical protein